VERRLRLDNSPYLAVTAGNQRQSTAIDALNRTHPTAVIGARNQSGVGITDAIDDIDINSAADVTDAYENSQPLMIESDISEENIENDCNLDNDVTLDRGNINQLVCNNFDRIEGYSNCSVRVNLLPEQDCQTKIEMLNDVSIYFQNINRGRQKIIEIYKSVLTNEYDVIILLETNLDDSFYSEELFDDRYVVFRGDRNERTSVKKEGGGVLIAVKRKFDVSEVDVFHKEFLEHVWLKFKFPNKNLFLCAIYLAPDVDLACYSMHVEDVKYIFDSLEINDDMIVCGDYNLSEVQWTRDTESNLLLPLNILKEKSQVLLENVAFCDLDQINDVPNERGKYLDLVFSNVIDSKIRINQCEQPLVKLDRHHLAYEFNYNSMDYEFVSMESDKKVFNFKKANLNEILTELITYDWGIWEQENDINVLSETFFNVLMEIFEKHVPLRFIRKDSNKKPWFNRSLSNLKNRRDRAAKKFRKFQKQCPLNINNVLCSECMDKKIKYARLRNDFKRMHDLLYKSYIERVENGIKTDPSKFFQFVDMKKKNLMR